MLQFHFVWQSAVSFAGRNDEISKSNDHHMDPDKNRSQRLERAEDFKPGCHNTVLLLPHSVIILYGSDKSVHSSFSYAFRGVLCQRTASSDYNFNTGSFWRGRHQTNGSSGKHAGACRKPAFPGCCHFSVWDLYSCRNGKR